MLKKSNYLVNTSFNPNSTELHLITAQMISSKIKIVSYSTILSVSLIRPMNQFFLTREMDMSCEYPWSQ